MRRAIVKFSIEALEHYFPLPKGTKIVDILPDESYRRGYEQSRVLELVVENNETTELPEVAEGNLYPLMRILVDDDGSIKFTV